MKSKNSIRRWLVGFTLLDGLAIAGAVAAVVGLGAVTVTRVRQANRQTKLEQDVASINAAVRTYLSQGGSFSSGLDAQQVLERLKNPVDSAATPSTAALSNSLVDLRLKASEATSTNGPRAVWNETFHRFLIADSGVGVGEFALDEAAAAQSGVTFSKRQAAGMATVAAVGGSGAGATVAKSNAPRLAPPIFSSGGGIYDCLQLPLTLQFSNPNTDPGSKVLVSLNGAPWQTYDSRFGIKVPRQLTTSVKAVCVPSDPVRFAESIPAEETYLTVYFNGSTSAQFGNPRGGRAAKTNLGVGEKAASFRWGQPVNGRSSELSFTGVANIAALPDREFKLGELRFHNGMIQPGSAPENVEMEINLNFVELGAQRVSMPVVLQSGISNVVGSAQELGGISFSSPVARLNTRIQGQVFYLKLRFGRCDQDGYTANAEFTANDGKTATAPIYGLLTANPQSLN